MKTITIANQKGGIGKTTTAMALAGILKERGNKVLIIDTDMQCNTTDTYRAKMDDAPTIYDVLLADERMSINEAVQHTESGDIIASDRLLIEADDKLKSDSEGIYRLQDAIKDCKGYDYIIIDTNPTLNHLLFNCLVASDEIVIPVTADRYGFTGLQQLSQTIEKIKRRQNPNLKVLGLLLVKYKGKTRLGKEVKEILSMVSKEMDTSLFDSYIRESIKVQEAQAKRMPLIKYSRNCTSALDYEDFVDELLKREEMK